MAPKRPGMPRGLMPWQRMILDVALEVDPVTGEWAYQNIVITVPRQAGKTTMLRPVILHRMGKIENARIFMAAQSRKKAAKRLDDLAGDVKRSILWRDVKYLTGTDNEKLTMRRNDSSVEPVAPNGDGMHGETPDLMAIDELWWYDAVRAVQLQGAYEPGFLTKSAQAWKFSTAGTSASWWLNTSRSTGRAAVEAGVRRGTAFFEWSLPDVIDGIPFEDLSDDKLVQACIDFHPSPLIRPESIITAWANKIDRNDFIRAYGNRTAEDMTVLWRAIDKQIWFESTDLRGIPSDVPVALGFDVDPERREASISLSWRDGNGVMHTEVAPPSRTNANMTQDGTRWVAGRLVEICESNPIVAVAVNNAGPARDVADEVARPLEDLGIPLLRIQQWDYSAACNRHHDELAAGSWKHRGEAALTLAASAANWRTSGQSRMWGRATEPVSTLVAQTLAGWAFDHAPEPVKPLPKFWMG